MSCRWRKYSRDQVFACHVVHLDAAINHHHVEGMARLTEVAHRSDSFNFTLIGGKSFVFALDGTDFDLGGVHTDKVPDCYEFVDFQICRLNLQIVETTETFKAVYSDCTVVGAANENVRVGRVEGQTRDSSHLVFILVDQSFRFRKLPYC